MNILCIDDDRAFLTHISIQLKNHVQKAFTAASLKEGFELLEKNEIDLVFLDIGFDSNENGIEGLKLIKKCYPDIQVIMLSGRKDPESIIESMKGGAFDYLCKPFIKEEALSIIENVKQFGYMKERQDALITNLNEKDDRFQLIGKSPSFKKLLEQVEKIKGYNANVLIEGESGTGKELIARLVHKNEGSSIRPFIAVNCAAIPDTLLESELFGYERGAFTGAHKRKIGKFQLAHGGDIFLDEISLLKPDLQAKILRVLQEKEIVRIGGNTPIKVNFRVIAATNKSLESLIKDNSFRLDLFHRLRIIHLVVPPLTERVEDIPVLAYHFLEKYRTNGRTKTISESALNILKSYSWPGNVRELENVIHSSMIMTRGSVIDVDNLPNWLTKKDLSASTSSQINLSFQNEDGNFVTLKQYQLDTERTYISSILDAVKDNKDEAAKIMGIGKSTLYVKLKELGLQ